MCHSSVSWEITLLYFLCWDFIWFKQKEPIKVENFRLLIAQVKFHQICTLIGFVCWKYIKVQLKGCRGVMPRNTEERCKVRGKTDFLFKKWISWILTGALKSLKNLHFDCFFLCKVYNVWPKEVQRSYLSWHWKVMENFKKIWLMVWEMTWGILQTFTRTLVGLKIGTLMGSFYQK